MLIPFYKKLRRRFSVVALLCISLTVLCIVILNIAETRSFSLTSLRELSRNWLSRHGDENVEKVKYLASLKDASFLDFFSGSENLHVSAGLSESLPHLVDSTNNYRDRHLVDDDLERTIPVVKGDEREHTDPESPFLGPIFVFISNTEECIDNVWLSSDNVGDASQCNCDVIVISYRRPCRNNSLPHIHYIFAPKTTMTTGKNLAVSTARSRLNRNYLYYIIHDDDIEYGDTMFQREEKLKVSPLRAFLDFLVQFTPAVGVPSYGWIQSPAFLSGFQRKTCQRNASTVAPVTCFDACTYAMHRNAVGVIYPLTDFLVTTGIYAHRQVKLMAMIAFPGQVLAYLGTRAFNKKSRRYNGGGAKYRQLQPDEKPSYEWPAIIAGVNERLPLKYRNNILIQFMKYAVTKHRYEFLKDWLCLDILPANSTIEPFSRILTPQNITCPFVTQEEECGTGIFRSSTN